MEANEWNEQTTQIIKSNKALLEGVAQIIGKQQQLSKMIEELLEKHPAHPTEQKIILDRSQNTIIQNNYLNELYSLIKASNAALEHFKDIDTKRKQHKILHWSWATLAFILFCSTTLLHTYYERNRMKSETIHQKLERIQIYNPSFIKLIDSLYDIPNVVPISSNSKTKKPSKKKGK